MERSITPRGKGIFVTRLVPTNILERIEWLKLDWVMIETIGYSGDEINSIEDLGPVVEHLKALNIDPWLWGWPKPDSIDAFVAHLCEALTKSGALG